MTSEFLRTLLAWPGHLPLAVLWNGMGKSPDGASRGRLVLAQPTRRVSIPLRISPAALRDVLGGMEAGESASNSMRTERSPGSTWIGVLGYELGMVLEPGRFHIDKRVQDGAFGSQFFRCDKTMVWSGSTDTSPESCSFPTSGSIAVQRDLPSIGTLKYDRRRAEYEAQVARAIEYIRAGDVYQVNLAHRMSASFSGSARAWFASWMMKCNPAYGAYLEWDEGGRRFAIASASPELFLRYEPTSRRLTTRPMKGTRPLAPGAREQLESSSKDRAELAMIVDLMRNDLGRVCELGSVRVDAQRTIEEHTGLGVLQATATVSGTLREGLAWHDAVLAAFPPGSVTGAPKIRAMQIIDELEGRPRGPYCGAIGFIADSGEWEFNVAIRTAFIEGAPAARSSLDTIQDGTIAYHAGAGIVAESDPAEEWRETIAKSRAFLRACGVESPSRDSG